MSSLIQKYNIPGPRYTSYPTVPYWDTFDKQSYMQTLARSVEESNEREGISLYIHLPFCESLCTFCACHKRITKKHEHESPYIDALLKEFGLYVKQLSVRLKIKEIHLGGGTPTFFTAENLARLLNGIYSQADLSENPELSFEGHPNNTSREHLQTLYNLGFRRVSFGVQDYDNKVQIAINRVQPFANVEKVHQWARDIGYTSISHDLVFGLPFQRWESVKSTIQKTISLMPDRLAFYSYAHVPWIKGVGQRGFDDNDLPSGAVKRELYENGKALLQELGYVEIGMDHFSLPQDELYQSMLKRKIHRNFMGYTSSSTQVMIGLGMSAIGDSWYGFAQNEKDLDAYYACLEKDELPLFKGHLLNQQDLIIRRHILNLMCHLHTRWDDPSLQFEQLPEVLARLSEMEQDGLLTILPNGIDITEAGRTFARNICMAFDLRMIAAKPETRIFSMTV